MKRVLFYIIICTLISCGRYDYTKNHMEAMGVEMGIPIDEYLVKLFERDSSWRCKVHKEIYSEQDSCYVQSLIHEPQTIDSCTICLSLIIYSTPQTKTVFHVEEMTVFDYGGSMVAYSHIPVIFYYSSVYANCMLFEEFPNNPELTTRYSNSDGEFLVKYKNSNKFIKQKEDYNLGKNQYQAMWQWGYGECFIRLENLDGPIISTHYIDYKGTRAFEEEKELFQKINKEDSIRKAEEMQRMYRIHGGKEKYEESMKKVGEKFRSEHQMHFKFDTFRIKPKK